MCNDFGHPNTQPDCEKLAMLVYDGQAFAITDFDPYEKPGKGDACNISMLSNCCANDYRYGKAESKRQDVDKVSGYNAEVEDSLVYPAHSIEGIFFPVVTDSGSPTVTRFLPSMTVGSSF